MEFYTFLRHLADSWGLLSMTLFFLGCCLWALRPSSKSLHAEAAQSIFRDDTAPAESQPSVCKEA